MSDSEPAGLLPEHPAVTDWVNDFDHTDPTWTEDPFPIWETLRAASPVVRWLPASDTNVPRPTWA